MKTTTMHASDLRSETNRRGAAEHFKRSPIKWWGGREFVPPRQPKRLRYDATAEELQHLVRFWAFNLIEVQYCCHTFRSGGANELSILGTAVERLNTLRAIVGMDVFNFLLDEAHAEFAKTIGPDEWADFHGETR